MLETREVGSKQGTPTLGDRKNLPCHSPPWDTSLSMGHQSCTKQGKISGRKRFLCKYICPWFLKIQIEIRMGPTI